MPRPYLEVITIEFCPTEVRYFYDCVRIHNEDENLLVGKSPLLMERIPVRRQETIAARRLPAAATPALHPPSQCTPAQPAVVVPELVPCLWIHDLK